MNSVKSLSSLTKLNVNKLNEICKQHGIPVDLPKAQKIEKLCKKLNIVRDANEIISTLKTLSDVASLSSKDLSSVVRTLGQTSTKGTKQSKLTFVCEKLGISTTGGDNNNKENIPVWVNEARERQRDDTHWSTDIRNMPPISLQNITEYLLKSPAHTGQHTSNFESFSKDKLLRYKTLRSYKLWKEDHIHSLRYHDFQPNIALVRCTSLASFEKQGTQYKTFVAISKETNKVLYGHCHCVAGLGEACTHVAGLLFAIEEFVSEGLSQIPDVTCTDKLCKWIVPKGPTETPKMIKNIQFSKYYPCKSPASSKTETSTQELQSIKDPRCLSDRHVNQSSAKELLDNLKATNPELPIVNILQSSFASSSSSPSSICSPLQLPSQLNSDDVHLIPSVEVEVESLPPTVSERVNRLVSMKTFIIKDILLVCYL